MEAAELAGLCAEAGIAEKAGEALQGRAEIVTLAQQEVKPFKAQRPEVDTCRASAGPGRNAAIGAACANGLGDVGTGWCELGVGEPRQPETLPFEQAQQQLLSAGRRRAER